MNRNKPKPRSREFWALVEDGQIELTTKRESTRSKPKAKQNTKHTYKLDTYQGIDYGQGLTNKLTTKETVSNTAEYKVTVLRSQITNKRRSML